MQRNLRLHAVLTALLLALGALVAPVAASAAVGDVGVEGPSHSGTGTPTGTKRATSALWFNDGAWWGNLWDTASSDFHIFRFNAATSSWADTGVVTEARVNTHHDVLWDGTILYVASYQFVNDGLPAEPNFPTTMRRFSYDSGQKTYTPLSSTLINNYRVETLTIDKDSTGRVWATWQQGNRIYLNVTGTDGKTWGTPFPHPAASSNVSVDDTSALIAFGPGKIGVMWSRQVDDATEGMYWSYHVDGASDTDWTTPVAVVSGQRSGDDHMNLKWLDSSGGRVFAAVKSSYISASQPLIQLLALSGTTWSVHTIATVAECPNRVMVLIDESTQMLRTFATYPKPSGTTNAGVCSNSGGAIYEKSAPLNDISFTTAKTARILDADQYAHNVTSTKQNLNSTARGTGNSGLLVLADVSSTNRYWHYHDPSGGAGVDTTPPSVTGTSPLAGGTGVPVTANVTGQFSEAMNASTVTPETFTLQDGATAVPAAVTYNSTDRAATLNPDADLAAGTTYTATIKSGAGGVKDLAGNALATDKTWTFTTALPPAPVASFTATPTSGTAPLNVSFTDTSTGSPTSWSWDFGDGGTSTAQNPAHTYTTAGSYTATLTASNAGGSSSANSTITVNPAAIPAPVASFTATPNSGTAPLNVSFTDTSTGSPTSWSWDFGDGGTSTVQNPAHTYTAAGTYTATLTASNAGGSNPTNTTITVNPGPPPAAPTLNAPSVVNLANVTAVPISGTAQAASTVNVTASDGAGHEVNGTATATSMGAWSLPTLDLSSLDDGTVTLTATATDASGVVGPATTATVPKDTVPPTAPTLTAPATVAAATVASVPLSGTAEADGSISLKITDAGAVHTVTTTVTADGSGNWSTTSDLTILNDGQLTYTATATDTAGNTASAAQTGTKKTTATAPQFTNVPSFITGDTSDAVALTGTSDPGATVALTVTDSANQSVSATATANGSGIWSATMNLSTFNSGPVTFSAQATDTSGNVSTVTTATSRIGPRVVSITLQNGGTAGTADTNDKAVVVFNTPMSPSSFCSNWTSATGPWTQTGNSVSVLISRNTTAPNDALTVSAGCTANNFGTVNLGARYTTSTGGNLTFKGTGNRPPSSVSLSADRKTLTITLGVLKSGTPATGVQAGTPTYQGTANGQPGIPTDTNGVPLGTKPSGSGTAWRL